MNEGEGVVVWVVVYTRSVNEGEGGGGCDAGGGVRCFDSSTWVLHHTYAYTHIHTYIERDIDLHPFEHMDALAYSYSQSTPYLAVFKICSLPNLNLNNLNLNLNNTLTLTLITLTLT